MEQHPRITGRDIDNERLGQVHSRTVHRAPIQLDWPGLPHTLQEDDLLCQLYRDGSPSSPQSYVRQTDISIGQVIIREELPGGFGGARVLVVIPVERSGVHQAARVVKLGPRVMLEAERENYDAFVRNHLHTAVASQMRFAVQGTMAAIEYVFVGGGLLEPVTGLNAYYASQNARDIAETLRALLSEYLYQYWYRQGTLLEEHTAIEYGPHLPAQVTLELRSTSDDQVWSAEEEAPQAASTYRSLAMETLPLASGDVALGEQVQIDDVEVVRIKPWAATLMYTRERQARVRIEYDPESGIVQQLRIGERISVRGQVTATRHSLLAAVVQVAFRDCDEARVAVDDDKVLAGLGRGPYPNPLRLYPALLNEMLEGRRSIIHGDLHLRNVLVDGDGRPWLIDFGRVREGHTLFDLIKLETYIRLDILSRRGGFSLAEYARFEEALADATIYGLQTAGLPLNPELRKAFRVIWAIRCVAKSLQPEKDWTKAYSKCLLLYNLAVLKYARDAVRLQEREDGEHDLQLAASRLCFVTAAIQGRWLEDPPQPHVRLRGVIEQGREGLLQKLAQHTTQMLVLFLIILGAVIAGLGFSTYHFRNEAWRAHARSLDCQGAVYLGQGTVEAAEALLMQAIDEDPELPTARHNLGMVYYAQGDLGRASEQFQRAMALDPTYADPHYALGRFYDEQGRDQEALSELEIAIGLDPGMSDAYNEIGFILNRQGRHAQAINVLQEGLLRGRERSPPYLLKNLGRAYLGIGDAAQAIEPLEVAAALLSPSDTAYVDTHRLLAEAYEAVGKMDTALKEWRGPLQNEPDAADHIQRLSPPPNGGTK